MVLLHPEGFVARQQSHMMIVTTAILMSIIIPVIIACFVVAWHYRASNKRARYDAKWDHSPQIELLVWGWPVLIIMAVGGISWVGTHQLDPYRPLTEVSQGQPVAANDPPLEVDVVSLRWKWLFFYPQYDIATVNQLAAPIDRPISFKLTSDAMMDSFFVPALAGQIYTMPAMQTVLHGVINKPGIYRGFSANYSGKGFTDMRFKFHGMSKADFKQWVAKVRDSGKTLDTTTYEQLKKPERNAPITYYAHFEKGLYERILNRCVQPGQTCVSTWMAEDAHGGRYDKHDGKAATMSMPGKPDNTAAATDSSKAPAAPVATMH